MSEVVPLPSFGEVFFDARGQERVLRVTWHDGTLVLSLWRGEMCTASFRMPMEDVGRLLDTLDEGYAAAGGDYAEGHEGGHGDQGDHADAHSEHSEHTEYAGYSGYSEYPEYPEYPGTGQYARPAGVPADQGEYTQALPYPGTYPDPGPDGQAAHGQDAHGHDAAYPRQDAGEPPVPALGPKDVLVARGTAPTSDRLVASGSRPADPGPPRSGRAGGQVPAQAARPMPVDHPGPPPMPSTGPQPIPPSPGAGGHGPHPEYGPEYDRSPEYGPPPDHGRSSAFGPAPGYGGHPGYGDGPADHAGAPRYGGSSAYDDPPADLGVHPDFTPPSGFSFAEGNTPRPGAGPSPHGEYANPNDYPPRDGHQVHGDYGTRDDYGSAAEYGGYGRRTGDPAGSFATGEYGTPALDYSGHPGQAPAPDYPPPTEYGVAGRYGGDPGEIMPRENLIVNDSLPFGSPPAGRQEPGYPADPSGAYGRPAQQGPVDPSDPLGLGAMGRSPDGPQLSRPYVDEGMYTTGERIRPEGHHHPDEGGHPYSGEKGREW